jgi:hypothetical protein
MNKGRIGYLKKKKHAKSNSFFFLNKAKDLLPFSLIEKRVFE